MWDIEAAKQYGNRLSKHLIAFQTKLCYTDQAEEADMYAEFELLRLTRRFQSQFPNDCFYCGCKVKKVRPKPREACAKNKLHLVGRSPWYARTKDHVIPRVEGGFITVVACFKCNNEKGSQSLEQFRVMCGVKYFYFERVLAPSPSQISVELLTSHFNRFKTVANS